MLRGESVVMGMMNVISEQPEQATQGIGGHSIWTVQRWQTRWYPHYHSCSRNPGSLYHINYGIAGKKRVLPGLGRKNGRPDTLPVGSLALLKAEEDVTSRMYVDLI